MKKNEEIVETLGERILGRVVLQDVVNPLTNDILVHAGEQITEAIMKVIENSPVEKVEVRSPLVCEATKGICAKCYGRNLATGKMTQRGEAVGVIAAQSIGEPGTQLTLRTFHVGGVAGGISEESNILAKFAGRLEIEDLKTVKGEDGEGNLVDIVISRSTEMKLIDQKTGILLATNNIPYGSSIYVNDAQVVEKEMLFVNGIHIMELSFLSLPEKLLTKI